MCKLFLLLVGIYLPCLALRARVGVWSALVILLFQYLNLTYHFADVSKMVRYIFSCMLQVSLAILMIDNNLRYW